MYPVNRYEDNLRQPYINALPANSKGVYGNTWKNQIHMIHYVKIGEIP